jgi:hypothetical protein
METIKIMFSNIRGTLSILGLLFFLMAIVGGIDTQWLTVDFSSAIQRAALVALGILSILLGWFTELRPGESSPKRLPENSTFEWQWAAENWYGRILVNEINKKNVITQAKAGLIQKTMKRDGAESRILMDGLILQLVPNSQGTFEVTKTGANIDLLVQKKGRGSERIVLENIKGHLSAVPCYAGRVSFSSEEGTYTGDMILVGYQSQLGSQVDDWFKNDHKWFEKYLLDR